MSQIIPQTCPRWCPSHTNSTLQWLYIVWDARQRWAERASLQTGDVRPLSLLGIARSQELAHLLSVQWHTYYPYIQNFGPFTPTGNWYLIDPYLSCLFNSWRLDWLVPAQTIRQTNVLLDWSSATGSQPNLHDSKVFSVYRGSKFIANTRHLESSPTLVCWQWTRTLWGSRKVKDELP